MKIMNDKQKEMQMIWQSKKARLNIRTEYDKAQKLAYTKLKEANKVIDEQITKFTEDFMEGRVKVGDRIKVDKAALKLVNKYSKLESEIIDVKRIHQDRILQEMASKDPIDTKIKNINSQWDRAIKQLEGFKKILN